MAFNMTMITNKPKREAWKHSFLSSSQKDRDLGILSWQPSPITHLHYTSLYCGQGIVSHPGLRFLGVPNNYINRQHDTNFLICKKAAVAKWEV